MKIIDDLFCVGSFSIFYFMCTETTKFQQRKGKNENVIQHIEGGKISRSVTGNVTSMAQEGEVSSSDNPRWTA